MTDNIKPTVQEKSAWAKVPQEFNDWWNGDYSDESNPFRINSAAYWAWAGWSEAVRLNAQAQQPLTDEKEALALLDAENARLTKLVIELRSEVVRLNARAVPAAPQPAQPAPKPLGWVRPNPGATSGLFEYGTECPPGWVGSAFSVLASAVPTAQPMTDVVRKALDRAFVMGQNYWADADSESYSANKRSDVTRQKFNAMRDEVCAQLDGIKEQP